MKIVTENATMLDCSEVLRKMDISFGDDIQFYLNWFKKLRSSSPIETLEALGSEPELPPVNTGDFELGISDFKKLFPKLENSSDRPMLLLLLKRATCLMINYRHNELLNGFDEKLNGIGNEYVLENLDVIDCLRYKRMGQCVPHYEKDSFSKSSLKRKLSERVWYPNKCLAEIEKGDVSPNTIFQRLF